MGLNLDAVTICAIDCAKPALAANALNISTHEILFGDSILFSDQIIEGNFRSKIIPKIKSKTEYSKFIIENLVKHIQTEYVLVVQWDGFVTSPQAWQKDFLNYDYIGARWPWYEDGHAVGNGGFSLRSKKLMKLFLDLKLKMDYSFSEDHIICRQYRSILEANGMRFGTDEVARKFSHEREIPESKTFGFHGLFNIWRYLEDSKVLPLIDQLDASVILSREYIELLIVYMLTSKLSIFKGMYQVLLKNLQGTNIASHLKQLIDDDPMIVGLILDTAKSI